VWDNRSYGDYERWWKKIQEVRVAITLVEADILLNLPKIKTHAITRLTCA
jgi:uncharacterized protein (DUF362 family)